MNKKYDLAHEKGFPFLLEDFENILNGISESDVQLLKVVSNLTYNGDVTAILQGVILTQVGPDYNVSAGYLLHEGCIVYFPGGNITTATAANIYLTFNKSNQNSRAWGDGTIREVNYQYSPVLQLSAGDVQLTSLSRLHDYGDFNITGQWAFVAGNSLYNPLTRKSFRRVSLSGRLKYTGGATSDAPIGTLNISGVATPRATTIFPVTIDRGGLMYCAFLKVTDTGSLSVISLNSESINTNDIVYFEGVNWEVS